MPYLPIRTAADVQQNLIVGTTKENHWLDFKNALGGDNAENAKDVAQFANASGGTLVIGALESAQILTGSDNVPKPATVIGQVEGIVGGYLTPVPIIEPYIVEAANRKTIVVVNVPPSIGLVALHGQSKEEKWYEFVVRGHESKRYMTVQEVEARMQNSERAMKLRIGAIPADASVGLDAFIREVGHNDWRVADVDDDVIRLKKNGAELVAPLAYVEAVYQAGEPGAKWVIRLPCYIAKHARTKRLHLTRELPSGVRPEKFKSRGLD